MMSKKYENPYYTIENEKGEFFHFIDDSFSFTSYWRYVERHSCIRPEELELFAKCLGTINDKQSIYDAAKIKLKGFDLDKFRELLTENTINFTMAWYRD